mmetsp:Transcript_7958/g.17683  ORF Transcript_7958/g.17683 Transcript_7958/m.17683 type:complete len:271 (+) Transcript_7958:65-877(+)
MASGAKSTEPLLGEQEPKVGWSLFGWTRLVGWRGDGTNRVAWKSLCTGLLFVVIGLYFYIVNSVPQRLMLDIMATCFAAKGLVEVWGQDTPTWICPGTVFMLFVIYGGIMPWVLYSYGICVHEPDINFSHVHLLGFVMYIFGSVYSLAYEVGRFRWKKLPENKGKLHTIDLAALSIHPNYFGDLFTYSGWALACGTTCALNVPATMVFTFAFVVIPNSDAYLATKYEGQWEPYAEKTATLIPGLKSTLALKVLGVICLVLAIYLNGRCVM